MTFFEKHIEYITACVHVRALEVAYLTRRHADLEDYSQELILYILRYADRYQADRASPHTFINQLAISAKMNLLRHLRSGKNKIITQALEIEYVQI